MTSGPTSGYKRAAFIGLFCRWRLDSLLQCHQANAVEKQGDLEMRPILTAAIVAVMSSGLLPGAAGAAPITCLDTNNNHMQISDAEVSSCLDAGTGNINGNPMNDPFLTGVGSAYTSAGKTDGANPYNLQYTQTNGTGTWSCDSTFWNANSVAAIGFKFGTGNNPDEWFVYQVRNGVSSGNWTFNNVYKSGGGLSHANLYSVLCSRTGHPSLIRSWAARNRSGGSTTEAQPLDRSFRR